MGVGRRRACWALGFVVAGVLAAGCGGGSSPAATPPPAGTAVTVDIRNIAFNPTTITVHPGDTVAWRFNDGSVAHNVVGDGWRSPDRTSGYYTHTFDTAGTYAYRCTIHTGMTGQVVVVGVTK